jgi:hypothetical protein
MIYFESIVVENYYDIFLLFIPPYIPVKILEYFVY